MSEQDVLPDGNRPLQEPAEFSVLLAVPPVPQLAPAEDWRLGDPLTPLEAEMLHRAKDGGIVSLEGPFGLDAMQSWGPDRTVRARVLRHLLVDKKRPVDAKGVWLQGVRVSGCLDLEAATIRCPVHLDYCCLDCKGAVVLDYAETSVFKLTGCYVAGLKGDVLVVKRELDLTGTTFSEPLRIVGANITGKLDMTGAQFNGKNKDGYSLIADNVKVGGGVFLCSTKEAGTFSVAGGIRLSGADITGQLDMTGAHLKGRDKDGYSLVAENIKVGSNVSLRSPSEAGTFSVAGGIRLSRADITGQLDMAGAHLKGRDKDGYSLFAENIKVTNAFFYSTKEAGTFVAAGGIRLIGADITGQLAMVGAKLNGTDNDGFSLIADNVKVGGSAFFCSTKEAGTFVAAGGIRLPGADITGQLDMTGAQLKNKHCYSFFADNIKVGGNVVLCSSSEAATFIAAGVIQLMDASISGQLDMTGAQLNGTDENGYSLRADNVKVGSDVFLYSPSAEGIFSAVGGISLPGADITGQLNMTGAHLKGRDKEGYSLFADNIKVSRDVFLRSASKQITFIAVGGIRLSGADITGQLDMAGAHLKGRDKEGYSLFAQDIKVGDDVFLRSTSKQGTFSAADVIMFYCANITGGLDMSGAQLKNLISLKDAYVGGSLDLTDAVLAKAPMQAVDAERVEIRHVLSWRPAKPVNGSVSLEGATAAELKDNWKEGVNGYWPTNLQINGFKYIRIDAGDAAQNASVKQRLTWIRGRYKREDFLRTDLKRLLCSTFFLTGWARRTLTTGHPWLAFKAVIEAIRFALQAINVAFRVTIQAVKVAMFGEAKMDFASQPYEQLASVYRGAGRDTDARKVAIASRRDLRRWGRLRWYRRAFNWFLDKTIRYGYQTWRAFVWLAALYAAVLVIALIAQHHGAAVVPAKDTTGINPAPSALVCVSKYPCFYPTGYAFDTVVPIINIHQADYWRPDSTAVWGDTLLWFSWAGTVIGWLLVTLAVAGYTGLVRRVDAS
jgi:hypothetical protein